MSNTDYDAIVVGSGPNGLAAGITLQQQGLSVLLMEGKETIGGGLHSTELTLPGYTHDVCSAIHPLAVASPFFQSIPLKDFGLEFIHPPVLAAHPFDDGSAGVLHRSLEQTADSLGKDKETYLKLIQPLINNWPAISADVLAPFHIPRHPLAMAGFGKYALRSAKHLADFFSTEKAKGLWAGMAAHAIQPLSNLTTSAIGLVLLTVGHLHGWPIPKGGSQAIANALLKYFESLGGKVQTGSYVHSLDQLPAAKAILLDVTPKQLLEIGGNSFSSFYKWQLKNYRYGMGVFKMDWALSAKVPFINEECRKAGTVHLGNSFSEIAKSEKETWNGNHAEKPFVLLAQPSVFDNTRAPFEKHTLWAYCHVPNASTTDMTTAIENQIERFAPGFKKLIVERHVMNTKQMQAYNPNYIGGDINGGVIDIRQLYTRPALRISPYKTSAKGIYICSSATPPGGGVHGMCGYHAAQVALKDCF